MSHQLPRSPFATRLSGSAKETELRLRNIFQWKKQRPPVVLIILTALTVLLCCGLVSCQSAQEPDAPEDTAQDSPAVSPSAEPPGEVPSSAESTAEVSPSAEPPAEASPSVQTAPKVGVYIDAELILYDPLGGLTEEQKALLSALSADELPREPVELRDLYDEDVWRGTLIPMAADEAADVTLYGVVNAEKSEEPESHAAVIRAVDGVVLRVGDRTAYYPLLWDNVVWSGSNPWMSVRDYDGDGKNEAAVCLHAGHGTGFNVKCLYLFDLDTMTYTTPDYSTLDIDVSYDPGSRTAVLSASGHAVTVEVDPQFEPLEEVSCGCIVSFSCEDGQLFCHVSLDFSGYTVGYLADASAPIVWDGDGYRLGEITLSANDSF